MTTVIETIMTMYKAMDNDEKMDLTKAIGLQAIEDGLYSVDDLPSGAAKTILGSPIKATLSKPLPAGGGKKKGWKGKSLPYWVKKITNINNAQKGFHAWESEWVNDTTTDLAFGDVVLVGWKFEPKKYYLCKAINCDGISLPDGTKIENLELVKEAEKMGDLKDKAKEMLGIT
tara:strand:- start:13 stop:531 length:519 start_codon:yes stop_codon:yes gene_type:complete